MEISYKTLNKKLGIGNPVIEVPVEVFTDEDMTQDPSGEWYVRLPPIVLQVKGGHRYLDCYLHAKTDAELRKYSGKKARTILEVREKTFCPKEGKERHTTLLDLHVTDESVTHTIQVTLRGKESISWTQGRPQIPVVHVEGYGILLSEVVQKGRRPPPGFPTEEIVISEMVAVRPRTNVIRLKVPLRPEEPEYKWVNGGRVRVGDPRS